MTYLKVGQEIKTKSGLHGKIKTLDFFGGKVVSAGVEVKDDLYTEVVHVMADNIQAI